jgi:hypothetical protein
MQGYSRSEEKIMFIAGQLLASVLSCLFGIFMLWVLWMVVKCLKGIDESLKEIASSKGKSL